METSGQAQNTNCLGCMRRFEQALRTGSWKRLPKPLFFWYQAAAKEEELLRSLFKETKATSGIEVGCGPGRILEFMLAEIQAITCMVGVEHNPETAAYAKTRFRQERQVEILEAAPKIEKFDISLSMFSTAGNQAEPWIFVADLFNLSTRLTAFSVYKLGLEKERMRIYAQFGHENIQVAGSCIILNDKLVQNLRSQAFSYKEVEAACKALTKDYEIIDASHLNYVVVLRH
ncbi:MAG: class I SAM-dependent methyltransferase [Candidatus Burarchaeum sp.]|nr:class I SAM-dependent methyltransferase [Candidatus Burarchaeum sp.]MDO8339096.1 class I SAM-dependent methyltransferase [Candidatus Burarchaeum sp.]